MQPEQAKASIHETLGAVKAHLAQDAAPKLSEADTKAHFIEPIISALGWRGIGVVTREYYVKNSQEFIDYVMTGSNGPLLAIEAKSLQADLSDKHAAQLIQYCAVEGIEWAALTNGRELQFFNAYLKGDLAAKRVLRLDLLAFNSAAEFDALFELLWQLSRASMTTPEGVHMWLNRRRMDAAVRAVISDPNSPTIKALRKALVDAEIKTTPQDITQWFASRLDSKSTPILSVPQAELSIAKPSHIEPVSTDRESLSVAEAALFSGRRQVMRPLYESLRGAVNERWPDTRWRAAKSYAAAERADSETFLAVSVAARGLTIRLTLPQDPEWEMLEPFTGHWPRMTRMVRILAGDAIDERLLAMVSAAHVHAAQSIVQKAHYGVSMSDLINAGILKPGIPLVLLRGTTEFANATLSENGEILYGERAFRSPSDKVFAALMGHQSLNGWQHWHAELPEDRVSLLNLRSRLNTSTANIPNV